VLLTLLYLRRGYGMTAIGFFFGVSSSTICRVVERILPSVALAAKGGASLPRLLTPQDADKHVPPGHRFICFRCKFVTDGTYFDQPEQGLVQRSIYTKNKSRHCHKFIVMCHSDGTLIDVVGPCGNDTDENMFTAWVSKHRLQLQTFFAEGGAIVADRGFRAKSFQADVRAELAPCDITFAIPASKVAGQQRQDVVDYSRRVASERSQVGS